MQCRVHLNDDARTDWYSTMEMLIGGTWPRAASGRTEDVTSPFDGAVAGTVPVAGADDVRIALDRAEGPRSAVAEMTDVKTVILHGRPW
jgi:acyl-CoA reductase-like NAD-dependent aldehyde dehydrogenase